MIPLKALIVGMRWQLGVVVLAMAVLVWVAWRWLHAVRWPISWPWVLGYAAVITAASDAVQLTSMLVDEVVPVHIEVLLPAFVLVCVLARPAGHDPHADDAREGHHEGRESPAEQRVATLVSAFFRVLVGLSMPVIEVSGAGLGALLAVVLGIVAAGTLGTAVYRTWWIAVRLPKVTV